MSRDYQDRLRKQEFDLLCEGLDLDTVEGRRTLSQRIKDSDYDYNIMTEYMIQDAEARGFPNWWVSDGELAAWERSRLRQRSIYELVMNNPFMASLQLRPTEGKSMVFETLGWDAAPHEVQVAMYTRDDCVGQLQHDLLAAVNAYYIARGNPESTIAAGNLAVEMEKLKEWADRLNTMDAPDIRGVLFPAKED